MNKAIENIDFSIFVEEAKSFKLINRFCKNGTWFFEYENLTDEEYEKLEVEYESSAWYRGDKKRADRLNFIRRERKSGLYKKVS